MSGFVLKTGCDKHLLQRKHIHLSDNVKKIHLSGGTNKGINNYITVNTRGAESKTKYSKGGTLANKKLI
jgi:hypothetical protein